MTYIFDNIQNALNAHLATMTDIPEIFWPNTEKEPSRNQEWLRVSWMPANTDLFTLNNEDEHLGFYQVDIYTKLKEGTEPLLTLAGRIRAHFKGRSLTSGGDVIHIQAINPSPPRRDDAWWSCYLQINYQAFN